MELDPTELGMIAELFRDDSREQLAHMEEAILALESRPADLDNLLVIYRIAHNIKGSAGLIGFTGVGEFAHTVEDVLRGIQEGRVPVTGDLVALLLKSVDMLRTSIQVAFEGRMGISSDQTELARSLLCEAGACHLSVSSLSDQFKTDCGEDCIHTPSGSELFQIEERGFNKSRKAIPVGGEEVHVPEQTFASAADLAMPGGADIGAYDQTAACEDIGALSALSHDPTFDKSVQARRHGKTLRIDVDKLDRMLDLISEIAISRARLTQLILDPKPTCRDVIETHRSADPLCLELQEMIMKARMVPIGPTFRQFARTVRDVALAHGKQARLVVEGEDVEVDTAIVERIRDPLTHMIRNSLSHGIGSPEERVRLGKDPVGTITLRACHESGAIVLQVIDDGAGLSRQKIIDRVRRLNLFSDPEKLTDQELLPVIMQPGFSTASQVTDLSGRGVGMDVVKRNIEGLRGSVSLESRPGEGVTFTMRLPLTLSIISGLRVGVRDLTYIVPIDQVVECIQLQEPESNRQRPEGVVRLRGSLVPYIRLSQFLGFPAAASAKEKVVISETDDGPAGVAVDAVYGESQVVIKPLGELFEGIPGISGSTVLGNGDVALVLDLPGILRRAAAKRASDALACRAPQDVQLARVL